MQLWILYDYRVYKEITVIAKYNIETILNINLWNAVILPRIGLPLRTIQVKTDSSPSQINDN